MKKMPAAGELVTKNYFYLERGPYDIASVSAGKHKRSAINHKWACYRHV